MAHEPRQITFLGREGQTKHYGIADPRAAAERGAGRGRPRARRARRPRLHDRPRRASPPRSALVYWWANENELHAAPIRRRRSTTRARSSRSTGTGMACVWELEVIDFERRAWLEDVLIDGDVDAYLERALEPVAV